MKFTAAVVLATVASASAFAPQPTFKVSSALGNGGFVYGEFDDQLWSHDAKLGIYAKWDPNSPRSTRNFNPFETFEGNSPDASGIYPGEQRYKDPQRPDVSYAIMQAEKVDLDAMLAAPKAAPGCVGCKSGVGGNAPVVSGPPPIAAAAPVAAAPVAAAPVAAAPAAADGPVDWSSFASAPAAAAPAPVAAAPVAAAPAAAAPIEGGFTYGEFDDQLWSHDAKLGIYAKWDPNSPRSTRNFNPFETFEGNSPDASGIYPGEQRYKDPQRPDVSYAIMQAEKVDLDAMLAAPKAEPGCAGCKN